MRIKADFGPNKSGNPVWYHRYGLMAIIGTVLGIIVSIIIVGVSNE